MTEKEVSLARQGQGGMKRREESSGRAEKAVSVSIGQPISLCVCFSSCLSLNVSLSIFASFISVYFLRVCHCVCVSLYARALSLLSLPVSPQFAAWRLTKLMVGAVRRRPSTPVHDTSSSSRRAGVASRSTNVTVAATSLAARIWIVSVGYSTFTLSLVIVFVCVAL